jgi:xanthine dehydrogenase iron-sulfur cluster and FAD-binding subunit A
MWRNYLQPTTLEEALRLLREHSGKARIVAGGTDVIVELSRGIKPTETLIDVTRLRELKYVREEDGWLYLGALATHNDVLASPECREHALPLAQACIEIGAPQIRTRGTVAGNLVTASPANDTITALMALGAEVVLANVDGERVVALDNFYQGVRRTVLAPDELLREIRIPAMRENQRGLWLRLGLRRAQAISVIHIAFVLTFDAESKISEARITLGALAPVIVHAKQAEAFLVGKQLSSEVCKGAGKLACADVTPIGDLRGSAEYRLATLAALTAEGLRRIAEWKEAEGFPERPVLLDTGAPSHPMAEYGGTIETTINGQHHTLPDAHNKTLLNTLREDAGLTGTKEGCAEGECGACTVWIDGQAAMSCLVPAPQAHNAAITTIEGLATEGGLHPLQQSFIKHAAVQCGFCIPGFIMAGAKLLEEKSQPGMEDVQVAVSGNICRCTGYRKIFDAMLGAKS